MSETAGLPSKVRASKKWGGVWPFRGWIYTFDAHFDQQGIQHSVNLQQALQSERYPADYWQTRRAAEAQAQEGRPGRWVSYPTGNLLD